MPLIIIIDNPKNLDAINYVKELSLNDNRIKFYINEQNIGLANSLNKALKYANGTYIARMDADDIALPNRLEDSYNYLVNNKLDFVGGVYEIRQRQDSAFGTVGSTSGVVSFAAFVGNSSRISVVCVCTAMRASAISCISRSTG